MEKLELGVENDNGDIVNFKVDGIIINGLYETVELKKVRENIDNFEIDVNYEYSSGIKWYLSKRDRVVIVSMVVDDKNMAQYLVGDDMDPMELLSLDENEIVIEDKPKLLEAYELCRL